jgi:integrase
VARDVDVTPERVVLWVPDSKTDAGKRRLVVPEPLAGLLAARVKSKLGWLFPSESSDSGHREPTWLRKNIRKLCDDAGVPYVCPHGARGTAATLAELAGVAGEAVARQLGHTSHRITADHYLARGTVEQVRVDRLAEQLSCGRKRQ